MRVRRRSSSVFVRTLLSVGLLGAAPVGCVKSMAINALGDALATEGGTYARDDDPELVRDATAFGLKTIESLLDASPEHKGLHLAAVRGFTQYAFAYLQSEADYIEGENFNRAAELRRRAHRMFKRALSYGVRGLSLGKKDFLPALRADAEATLKKYDRADVPLLVWTGLALGAGISIDKDDADMGADLKLVEPLMQRALALDPGFGRGAIHDFFITWYAALPASAGGSDEKAKEHFEKALQFAQGQRIAPLVSFAEGVAAKQQDRATFDRLVDQALAFDVDAHPDFRLANLTARRRAQWLKANAEDLFL